MQGEPISALMISRMTGTQKTAWVDTQICIRYKKIESIGSPAGVARITASLLIGPSFKEGQFPIEASTKWQSSRNLV
jgi:hypothetical protein